MAGEQTEFPLIFLSFLSVFFCFLLLSFPFGLLFLIVTYTSCGFEEAIVTRKA